MQETRTKKARRERLLLLRQLKIDVLSVLVVTDKLNFVDMFARNRAK